MQIAQLSLKIVNWAHFIVTPAWNHDKKFLLVDLQRHPNERPSHTTFEPQKSSGKLLKMSEMMHIACWLTIVLLDNMLTNLVAVACPTLEGERGFQEIKEQDICTLYNGSEGSVYVDLVRQLRVMWQ